MTSSIAVSILMPVYNAAPYVGEALESLLAQSFTDFEIVTIDDGSTDGSADVVRRYAERDGRIRLFSRPNKGISDTRNELLAKANGELIAWNDADDVSLPDRLEEQVGYLGENSRCVAVGTGIRLMDAQGMVLRDWPRPPEHAEIDAGLMHGLGAVIVFASTMMRRDAIEAAGRFRPGLVGAEDVDLLLRLAERGELANMPEMLYCYRQHAGSICHRRRDEIRGNIVEVVQEAHRRRGLAFPGLDIKAESVSLSQTYRKWAWWALAGRNTATARKYARAAWRGAPLSLESWRILLCAYRGR